ncbi:MAG TPA: hypothetical protein VGC99_13450 [Candidatus Tectomicrobia bacterium]
MRSYGSFRAAGPTMQELGGHPEHYLSWFLPLVTHMLGLGQDGQHVAVLIHRPPPIVAFA